MPVTRIGPRCERCVDEKVPVPRPATNGKLCFQHYLLAKAFGRTEADRRPLTQFETAEDLGITYGSDTPEFEAELDIWRREDDHHD